MTPGRRLLLLAERASWSCGLAGALVWGTFHLDAAAETRRSLEQFGMLRNGVPHTGLPGESLWSPARLSTLRAAVTPPSPALAVLRIPKIRLEAPVLSGTDDRTLGRGLGHIAGTATPGSAGNSGIAGHRDGLFRGLKDIAAGDTIELETLHEREVYRIERTWVVDPEDVSVLDPTPARSLTLVTCYPFYFVGAAPRRFIVRAVLAETRLEH